MSVAEAARVSGISKSELYRWIETGKLKTRLIGGKMVNGQMKEGDIGCGGVLDRRHRLPAGIGLNREGWQMMPSFSCTS